MKKLWILVCLCPLLVWGQQLVQAEYFFDEEPGYGQGITINVAAQGNISLTEHLDMTLISPGFHTLGYRFKDDKNGWGHTYTSNVFVGKEKAQLQQGEYFFDTDPGYGQGIKIHFKDSTALMYSDLLLLDNITPGLHTFYYRLKSESVWGTTVSHKIYKPATAKISKIIYRFDASSHEYVIPLTSPVHNLSHEKTIDISALTVGEHQIHFYVENTLGVKSESWTSTVIVGTGNALNPNSTSTLGFYPNPASDQLYFSGEIPMDEIMIISTSGKVLKSYRQQSEISISDLPNGLYLLSYQHNGKIIISSLLIQH